MSKRKRLLILLVITFSLKVALGLYFSHLLVCQFPEKQMGFIAVDGGDTFSYLGSIDNLIATGDYYFWNGTRKVFAGRMPFYGAPYFLLRQLFDKSAAADVYILIQIFFDALATVVFARLCFHVSGTRSAFWLGYAVYLGSFNFFALSIALWTESLSLSFFVFFLYFYHRFRSSRDFKNAVWCGVFLALITSLKPYFLVLYPLFFIAVLLNLRRGRDRNFSQIFADLCRTAALGLPLIILLSPWIARNARVLGKFIPAQENLRAGYNYSEAHLAFVGFAGSWGGGTVDWDANDAGCYFLLAGATKCRYTIPEYALTNGYSREEIERVRQNFIELQRNFSPELDAATAAEFERLASIYQREQPFRYLIGSKFVFLKTLFWHTNNYNLPIHPSFKCFSNYQLLFKIIQFGIYFLALTLGIVGLVKATVEKKVGVLFTAVVLVTIIVFLELRTGEQRYVSHVLPILLTGLAAFLSEWKDLLSLDNMRNGFKAEK